MSELAIRTTQLSRNFATVRAVDSLNLEVPRGTVFGFLGPNGSGKTTTIRLLLGLLEPTSGSAQVLGFDTMKAGDQIRQRCGALLEHSGLYERLSAEDNLVYFARIWRMPEAENQKRIKKLLGDLNLWDRRKESVLDWSRGMKQKLAVARALLHNPEVVFLDEPTSGLDPIAAAALRSDLASLAEGAGVTVFLTTHNLAEAEKLCNQIAVIQKGRLLAQGSPAGLRARASSPRLEIIGKGFSEQVRLAVQAHPEVRSVQVLNGRGTDEFTAFDRMVIDLRELVSTAPLVNLLVQAGVQVEEVQQKKADLEEVFLNLVSNGGNDANTRGVENAD